jgi:pimeloyl-ACP methyl ester carboxylesterase
MGTLVCQRAAVQEPSRVASLALFGPLSAAPEASRRALEQRALRAREGGPAAMHTIADTLAQATLSASTRRDEPLAGAFVREVIRRNHPTSYALHCEALACAEEEPLEVVEAPTLLVTGDEDSVTPPQMMRSMAGRLSSSALVQSHVLRGCGHWTPIERRAECLGLWSDFVRVSIRAQRYSRAGTTV